MADRRRRSRADVIVWFRQQRQWRSTCPNRIFISSKNVFRMSYEVKRFAKIKMEDSVGMVGTSGNAINNRIIYSRFLSSREMGKFIARIERLRIAMADRRQSIRWISVGVSITFLFLHFVIGRSQPRIHEINVSHKLFFSVEATHTRYEQAHTVTAIHQIPCESSVAIGLTRCPFPVSSIFSLFGRRERKKEKKNVKNELVTHAITSLLVRGVMPAYSVHQFGRQRHVPYQMGFVRYNWWSLVHVISTSPTAKRNEPRTMRSLFHCGRVGIRCCWIWFLFLYSLCDDDEDRACLGIGKSECICPSPISAPEIYTNGEEEENNKININK